MGVVLESAMMTIYIIWLYVMSWGFMECVEGGRGHTSHSMDQPVAGASCGQPHHIPWPPLTPLVHPLLLQVTISVVMTLSRFGAQAMWPWHAMKVCPPSCTLVVLHIV